MQVPRHGLISAYLIITVDHAGNDEQDVELGANRTFSLEWLANLPISRDSSGETSGSGPNTVDSRIIHYELRGALSQRHCV